MKEALQWLQGESATFGELVAHVAPYDRRSPQPTSLVIDDVAALLSNVSEAFRPRHIYAHEAVPDLRVDAETCLALLGERVLLEGLNERRALGHDIRRRAPHSGRNERVRLAPSP